VKGRNIFIDEVKAAFASSDCSIKKGNEMKFRVGLACP